MRHLIFTILLPFVCLSNTAVIATASSLPPGCIDPCADNYDPEATVDDGSCVYSVFEIDVEVLSIPFVPVGGYCVGQPIELKIHVSSLTAFQDNYTLNVVYFDGDQDDLYEAEIDELFDGGDQAIVELSHIFDMASLGSTSYDGVPNAFSIFAYVETEGGCNQYLDISVPLEVFDCENILGCTSGTAINFNPAALIDDGSCVFDTATLELTLVGSNEVCTGEELAFVISGIGSLLPLSDLLIHFSDGGEAITYDIESMPSGNTFNYTFSLNSCGTTSLSEFDNAYTVAIAALDQFGSEYAWDSVDPIYVSGPGEFAQTGVFISPTPGPYCVGQSITMVNYSSGFSIVSPAGCESNYAVDFFTNAADVEVIAEDLTIFPQFAEIQISEEGIYQVGVNLNGQCVNSTAQQDIAVGPVAGEVKLWTSAEDNFSPVPQVEVSLYSYELSPSEFNSFSSNSSGLGLADFQNVPEGIYLARATPDPDVPEQVDFFATFSNEKTSWDQANLIVVGCNTVHKDTIYMKEQYGPSVFGGSAGGRLVYRDVPDGLILEPEVRLLVEGDPIPGIPIIISRDTSMSEIPGYEPFGSALTSGGLAVDQGYFNFLDLPEGNYRIHVDMPGLPMAETYFFGLSAELLSFESLNFYADSTDAIYISDLDGLQIIETLTEYSANVFPNPFETGFVLELGGQIDSSNMNWAIYDQAGRRVQPSWARLSRERMAVGAENLCSGFYILRLSSGSKVMNLKIIKR